MGPCNEVDALIEGCIVEISGNQFDQGAVLLHDLAKLWAEAGLPLASFIDMKSYIVASSYKNSNNHELEDKLKIAEVSLTKKRKEDGRAKTQEAN